MENMSIFHNFPISKEEVRTKNYNAVNELLEKLKKIGKGARGSLVLSFDYNDVREEIYEIEEITEYVRDLFLKHRYLFYYISDIPDFSVGIYMCLLGAIKVTQTGAHTSVAFSDPILSKRMQQIIIDATIEYGKIIGDESGARKTLESIGVPFLA